MDGNIGNCIPYILNLWVHGYSWKIMKENHRQDLVDVFEEIFNTLTISLEQRFEKFIKEEVTTVTSTQINEIVNNKLKTQRDVITQQLKKDIEEITNKKSRFWKWK